MSYSKAMICADFLMTKESEQCNNIRWVYDLLSEILMTSVHMELDKFIGYDDDKKSFSRSEFFSKSNVNLFKHEVQFYFSDSEVTELSVDYLSSFFSERVLLIGYELSEQTRNILNRAKVTYIDIWLHPIRYMDDVLFAFRSNSEQLNQVLESESLDDNVYKLYASRLKVQSYKGFKRSEFYLDDGSALFIGQTLNDKAVLSDGVMLTILDYKDKFIDLCKKHKKVYYSRHPFVKSGDEKVIEFINSISNVEIIDKPAYELITRDEIVTVATISSSVATEAKYFKKNSIVFYRLPVEIDSSLDFCYYSIYNKFCSIKFWNKLLSPMFDSKCELDVNFIDSKDKLRDALSFYWGYRHVDKVESLKITVGNLFKGKKDTVSQDNYFDIFISKLYEPSVDVVSFDIFDTLVCRKTSSPRDVFRILEKNISSIIGSKLTGFAALRIECEDVLRAEKLIETGIQDVTLSEIYSRFHQLSGLDVEVVEKIKEFELYLESRFLEKRIVGVELFERALRSGKRVILTSDMYLERECIEKILSDNDIFGYEKLYLSSEVGMRKHEGDLFLYVLSDMKIKASQLLHVGDNINGDINTPNKLNIHTFHIPRAVELFKKKNVRVSNVLTGKYKSLDVQQNLVVGAYVNRYFDSPNVASYGKSHFNKSPEELGYIGLGPLIASFCTQIYKIASSRGIKDIAFLSRDGKVVKKAFDILYPDGPNTHYMLSSRRATQVASIKNRSDILNILRKPVYSCQICDYFLNRFGVAQNEINPVYLLEAELYSKTAMIGGKFDKKRLRELVLKHEDVILRNAKAERESYLKYIDTFSLSNKTAIVDIGYSGSLQSFFNEFVNQDIFGFYLATFNTAAQNIDMSNAFSFISNYHNEAFPIHDINTHRFFYENVICSEDDTFQCFVDGEASFQPENDDVRKALVTDIHRGVEFFCRDISCVIDFNDNGLYLDPFNSSLLLRDFLRFPNESDVRMFCGIKFQDGFSSSVPRYIVPEQTQINDENIVKNSIWKEGVRCIKPTGGKLAKPIQTKVQPVVSEARNQLTSIPTTKPKLAGTPIKKRSKLINAIGYALNDRKKFVKKLKRHVL